MGTLFLGFFFFQAEDGIRDYKVTGVQTCALPICTDAGSATRANRNASSATWNRCATRKTRRSELQRTALAAWLMSSCEEQLEWFLIGLTRTEARLEPSADY